MSKFFFFVAFMNENKNEAQYTISDTCRAAKAKTAYPNDRDKLIGNADRYLFCIVRTRTRPRQRLTDQ